MASDLAKFVLHNDAVPESKLNSSAPKKIYGNKMVYGTAI
jgi:hypothetical protein